ncbi:MAG TPA: non-heme iron oxygenase ferredoxin subunit [Candidatus Polarisedimenticolia bacterium]|nr:non-heme iron oxygenase ferredoxin subunit [Candidatus Polarisedimenticolia bacterium]
MADFVKVATLSDLPPGTAKAVEVGGNSFALYNVGGTVYATTNTCPHRGGPLGEGELNESVITCPWHGFQYDVTTGKCQTNPALSLGCHPVRVEGQDVLVQA